jgi:hypothetical protein
LIQFFIKIKIKIIIIIINNMASNQQFTPGRKSNTGKIIQYIALYNAAFASRKDIEPLRCACLQDKFNKNISYAGSDSPSIRLSNNMRVSKLVNSYRGGKTQYGNFYLGKPLIVNYLGRTEGMPGGSGTAPKNIFN